MIIETDEYENSLHGQNVRDTFINGDIFIRISNKNIEHLAENIEKYLHLIFDTKIITPTSHEIAMHHAKSAAGNSACLSRQVGATIADENGVIIARGWNDVPQFGGNLYNDISSTRLGRCKDVGFCMNIQHRNNIIDKIEKDLEKIIYDSVPASVLGTHLSEIKQKVIEVLFFHQ